MYESGELRNIDIRDNLDRFNIEEYKNRLKNHTERMQKAGIT